MATNTERERQTRHAAQVAATRLSEATATSAHYRIIAFHRATRRVWVQGPQTPAHCVCWDTMRCDCEDARFTLPRVVSNARREGVEVEQLLCKHPHLVFEIVARMAETAGRTLVEFDDVLTALVALAPKLPSVPPMPTTARKAEWD